MLTAAQERIAEQNMPDWKRIQVIADQAAQLLLAPRQRVH